MKRSALPDKPLSDGVTRALKREKFDNDDEVGIKTENNDDALAMATDTDDEEGGDAADNEKRIKAEMAGSNNVIKIQADIDAIKAEDTDDEAVPDEVPSFAFKQETDDEVEKDADKAAIKEETDDEADSNKDLLQIKDETDDEVETEIFQAQRQLNLATKEVEVAEAALAETRDSIATLVDESAKHGNSDVYQESGKLFRGGWSDSHWADIVPQLRRAKEGVGKEPEEGVWNWHNLDFSDMPTWKECYREVFREFFPINGTIDPPREFKRVQQG